METNPDKLIIGLRRMVEKHLRKVGKLEKGEIVSIRAFIITPSKRIRGGINLDAGLDTFRLNGTGFSERSLTKPELEEIQSIDWPSHWQQAVVDEIIKNNNEPLLGNHIRNLAAQFGWTKRDGQLHSIDWVLTPINNVLRKNSRPFRVISTNRCLKHIVDGSYRFYALVKEE